MLKAGQLLFKRGLLAETAASVLKSKVCRKFHAALFSLFYNLLCKCKQARHTRLRLDRANGSFLSMIGVRRSLEPKRQFNLARIRESSPLLWQYDPNGVSGSQAFHWNWHFKSS
uniref:Uncharacterized protein n=1 Tax=Sphaerodactylus townsendi TaxID=933632 RepID=A0ACB8FWZ3_9SAUR